MRLSIYVGLFMGILLNHLIASQSFFGEDRSFLEDLFDNRRHTKSKYRFWLKTFLKKFHNLKKPITLFEELFSRIQFVNYKINAFTPFLQD